MGQNRAKHLVHAQLADSPDQEFPIQHPLHGIGTAFREQGLVLGQADCDLPQPRFALAVHRQKDRFDVAIERLDIQKLEEENATLQDKIARLEPRRAFDADRETADVEITRREFENKNYSRYAILVDGCMQLKNIIRANRNAGASGMTCRSPFVAQKLDALNQAQTELAQYRAQCLDNQPVIADDKVDRLIEFANACLTSEPDGNARNAAYNAMTSLKSRRGEQANPISTAKVALLEDHQANAVLALLLAIFVDLLVLVCAIIGRHSGQSEQVCAIVLLFDRSRKVEDDDIEYLVSMPENPNQRGILSELVNMLIRKSLADYYGHDEETVALRYGARERLLHERDRETGGVSRPIITPASLLLSPAGPFLVRTSFTAVGPALIARRSRSPKSRSMTRNRRSTTKGCAPRRPASRSSLALPHRCCLPLPKNLVPWPINIVVADGGVLATSATLAIPSVPNHQASATADGVPLVPGAARRPPGAGGRPSVQIDSQLEPTAGCLPGKPLQLTLQG